MAKFRYEDEDVPTKLEVTVHPESGGRRLELRINGIGFLTFDERGSIYLHQRRCTWEKMGLPLGDNGKILQRLYE